MACMSSVESAWGLGMGCTNRERMSSEWFIESIAQIPKVCLWALVWALDFSEGL